MKQTKLNFAVLLLLLVGFVLAGCATYHVGNASLYPPHVRTVYVPMFESDSYRRNLGERLTEAVMKEIELKTPYKVVGTPSADSVLSAQIVGDTKRVIVEDWYDDPREVEMNLQVQVRWIDRHGGALSQGGAVSLPSEFTSVSAVGDVVPEAGQSIVTGQQEAIGRLAEQIVGLMEAPW